MSESLFDGWVGQLFGDVAPDAFGTFREPDHIALPGKPSVPSKYGRAGEVSKRPAQQSDKVPLSSQQGGSANTASQG